MAKGSGFRITATLIFAVVRSAVKYRSAESRDSTVAHTGVYKQVCALR